MQDYKSLDVYQKAKSFAVEIYKVTNSFPKEEIYGITSQLRRASSSIGANIAEGTGRFTKNDFANFLHISLGSAKECEYFLDLSYELRYLNEETYKRLTEELITISKMLTKFIQSIRKR